MFEVRLFSAFCGGIGSSLSSNSAELPRCLFKSSRSVFDTLRSWLVGFTLLGL